MYHPLNHFPSQGYFINFIVIFTALHFTLEVTHARNCKMYVIYFNKKISFIVIYKINHF